MKFAGFISKLDQKCRLTIAFLTIGAVLGLLELARFSANPPGFSLGATFLIRLIVPSVILVLALPAAALSALKHYRLLEVIDGDTDKTWFVMLNQTVAGKVSSLRLVEIAEDVVCDVPLYFAQFRLLLARSFAEAVSTFPALCFWLLVALSVSMPEVIKHVLEHSFPFSSYELQEYGAAMFNLAYLYMSVIMLCCAAAGIDNRFLEEMGGRMQSDLGITPGRGQIGFAVSLQDEACVSELAPQDLAFMQKLQDRVAKTRDN